MKCCDIQAGMLRHRVQLQRQQRTPDGIGGFDIEWTTYATVSAYIAPLSGTETVVAMQIQDSTTHRLYIRYRAEILPEDRVLFGERTFNIRSVLNLEERNRFIEMRAEEGVALQSPTPPAETVTFFGAPVTFNSEGVVYAGN